MKQVIYLADKSKYTSNEDLYFKVRHAEKRIYADDVVAKLPEVAGNSPYNKEWKIRKTDYIKLKQFLVNKKDPLNILDVGSGNCWMADKLTQINNSTVTALDLNSCELEQGARVFSSNNNLRIVYGDVFSLPVEEKFDAIVLAASVQYFPDLKKLIEKLLAILKTEGEIYIINSPFYKKSQLNDAKKRSVNYYAKLGMPEMSGHYFHHSFDELNGFNVEINQPSLFTKAFLKVFKQQTVFFPWIIISKA